jgi:hypothetical protein
MRALLPLSRPRVRLRRVPLYPASPTLDREHHDRLLLLLYVHGQVLASFNPPKRTGQLLPVRGQLTKYQGYPPSFKSFRERSRQCMDMMTQHRIPLPGSGGYRKKLKDGHILIFFGTPVL